ncbi:MAG: GbsR/MarR family transcriptional regulator [Pseudomonadales bacterium]
MTDHSRLSETIITHFGEMGGRWGLSRSVSQVYAHLLLSEAPQNADQIAETLAFSRSNVSIALKELQAWNLVRLQHQAGDRKEYFSVPENLWDIAMTLVRERRRRELDPMRDALRSALRDAPDNGDQSYGEQRAAQILDFVELVTGWLDDIQDLPPEDLLRLMRLGAGVTRILERTRKVTSRKKQ